jgi:hypothetical protein
MEATQERIATLDPSEIEKERSKIQRGFFFIDACGEEARRWLAELCDTDNVELQLLIKRSVRLFRRHELSSGLDLLAAIDHQLHLKVCGFASILRLLRRFEYAARAYAEYMVGDLESAKASLTKADLEISRIISLHEFLVPLAMHCTDFIIQRARIARRERRWAEVKEQISILERIFADCHPYCILDSGRPILLSDLREFLASLPLDEEQRTLARLFLGEDSPVGERVGQLEELIFSFPDLVIPYP